MHTRSRSFLFSCFLLLACSLQAQQYFSPAFREKMKKYRVKLELSLLVPKGDTLLQGFVPFNSKKTRLAPDFMMFKDPVKKMNVAFFIDTCGNHYNLQAEVRNDLSALFGIKDAEKYKMRNEDEWNVLLNAEEVVFTATAESKNIWGAFADYEKSVIICYYNNNSKGKIYLVLNFDSDLEEHHLDFMNLMTELSFYPHVPAAGLEPELIIQSGSNDYINTIAVSASGKLMAYAGEEGDLKIILGDGSKELRTIHAHRKKITNAEFSQNERLLVSSSEDSTIRCWEVETGKLVAELKGHKEVVNDIALFDQDRKLLSTSSDSTIKIWDLAKMECIRTMRGFKNKTAQVELRSDGKSAIINMLKGNIMRLDLENFTDTTIVSGFSRITDMAYPYSNAIVVSNGKAVKFIYTSGKERTISTEADSAYSMLVQVPVTDGSDNMRMLLLTEHGFGRLYDYDSHSFIKRFRYPDFDAQHYYSLAYNPRYNMAVYGGSSYCTVYWMSGDEYSFIEGTGYIPANGIETDEQNEVLMVRYSGFTSLFSLKSGRVIWNSNAAKVKFNGASSFKKSSGNIAYFSKDGELCTYDYRQNKVIYKFKPVSPPVHFSTLRSDSSFLYLTAEGNVLLHQKGNPQDKNIAKNYALTKLSLVKDTFLVCQENEAAILKNIYTGLNIGLGKFDLYKQGDAVNENRSYFAFRTADSSIHVFDKPGLHLVREIAVKEYKGRLVNFCFAPLEDKLVVSTSEAKTFVIDLNNTQAVKEFSLKGGYLYKPCFTADGKFLVTAGTDAYLRLWETKTYTNVLSSYMAYNGSYITLTPDKYYVASATFTKEANPNMAYYSYGNTLFELADLDLEYNRPDIVSKVLGYESDEVIGAYRKLYEKRLRRMHVDKNATAGSRDRPLLRSVSTYPAETRSSALRLFFIMHDDHKKLKRIKVTINDVPIYGVDGAEVLDGLTLSDYHSLPLATTIYLNKGWNKVSVKVVNEDNVESYPYTFTTWYSNSENKTLPKLHLIGIGVSKFKDAQYNLKYPAKDVRDAIKLFQDQKNNYSRIIVDTLLNDSATYENIMKLKEKINREHKEDSVGVNDKVIIFAATHGLLDKNLDYYLATYDVDFQNPSKNGLLYSEIEKLIDHIPPRNKVVLIDACHSGEIDKDEVVVKKSEPVEGEGAIAFRAASSTKISSGEGALKNSINLMKEMFIDLRKTSGATVISSAGGTEYAIEGEEWNNGVFSYSLINALRRHKADANNDNKVYLSELQKYIEVDVPTITHGRQQPTSRSENISNDVLIWKNDFNEELASAIKANDKELVEKLLRDGADVASTDTNGATTMMWAVMYGDLEMVKKLIAYKADYKTKGVIYAEDGGYFGNLLGIAAAKNKPDILKYLVEEKKISVQDVEFNPKTGKADGWPPVFYAVSTGNVKILDYLLAKGANINFRSDADQYGIALVAFGRSDLNICKKLLALGMDCKVRDTSGNTIVIRAVLSGSDEMVQLAAQSWNEAVNIPDYSGVTPLGYAAFYGMHTKFDILLKKGATTQLKLPNGQSLLHLAVRSKNTEMVKKVLALTPFMINAFDNTGLTPLLSAVLDSNVEVVQYLLDKGADIMLTDDKANTFEDYAAYVKSEKLLEIWKKYKK